MKRLELIGAHETTSRGARANQLLGLPLLNCRPSLRTLRSGRIHNLDDERRVRFLTSSIPRLLHVVCFHSFLLSLLFLIFQGLYYSGI